MERTEKKTSTRFTVRSTSEEITNEVTFVGSRVNVVVEVSQADIAMQKTEGQFR
jgi:hypothetical protein